MIKMVEAVIDDSDFNRTSIGRSMTRSCSCSAAIPALISRVSSHQKSTQILKRFGQSHDRLFRQRTSAIT